MAYAGLARIARLQDDTLQLPEGHAPSFIPLQAIKQARDALTGEGRKAAADPQELALHTLNGFVALSIYSPSEAASRAAALHVSPDAPS